MSTVGILGAAGKMGLALVRAAAAHPGLQMAAAWEQPQHAGLGRDVGDLAGIQTLGVALAPNVLLTDPACDVIVDFSAPQATANLAALAVRSQLQSALVVGTTGLQPAQLELLHQAAEKVAVIYATNYSVGINLLWKLARQAAAALGQEFDIEIIEAHHNQKKDAPSGTAVTLYQEVCRGRGLDPATAARHGREGWVGARTREEVGLHAVRGGDIVGDHTVLFAGPGERLEFKHQMHSREVLSRGAIRAAAWLAGRKAGWYGLDDMLGLKAE